MTSRRLLLAGLFLLQAACALAHEVHHDIEATGAVAVRLAYADGKPFSFEAFEAYPEGSDQAAQVGRTDREGRAVFVAGTVKHWRLKAFSADGHGVDIRFEAPAVTDVRGTTAAAGSAPNRASLLLFGFSLLLAVFGGYQLFLRNDTNPERSPETVGAGLPATPCVDPIAGKPAPTNPDTSSSPYKS